MKLAAQPAAHLDSQAVRRTGRVPGLILLCAAAGCSSLAPPDPYLGTIDATGFDALFRGGTTGCLAPRKGFGGASGLDPVSWFYLGTLSATQVDVLNLADPARAAPPGAYVISGCTPITEIFDPRLDNYVRTVQYPVLGNAEPEPTSPTTYRPWKVVVPVQVRDKNPKIVCNDVKSQRSVENRSGWDQNNKVYGQGDFNPATLASWPYGFVLPEGDWSQGLDLLPVPPNSDQVRGGKVTVKNWPMVNVAMPIMNTAVATASCPLVTNSTARYPRYPGDPQADFQFPQGAWVRGLLSGYLDGGDVPLNMDPAKCPALITTSRTCSAMAPCDTNQVCSAQGRCVSRLPVCPVFNDVYVPRTEATNLATGTVDLVDSVTMAKRTADVLMTFTATPGQPGFSPVCRVRQYDLTKVTCGRKEADLVAPRPLCTAAEIAATPAALVSTATDTYVNCLFLNANKS